MKRHGIQRGGEAANPVADRLPRDASDETLAEETGTWWTRASLALVCATVVAMSAGCSPPPVAAAAAASEKLYALQPDAIRVQAGDVVADVIRLKVTERVDESSGRVLSPARLSGRLFVENVSADQPIRLIGGRIVYLDAQGQEIALENGRAEPTIQFGASFGATGRLDPGKVATELLYAEFPTVALHGERLKAIRIDLTFSTTPSATDERQIRFPVSMASP